MLRLELGDIGLVVIDLGLERRLLEQIEEVALLDLGALDKQPLFEKGGDPGDQRHPPDRLDAADEFIGLGDLLALGRHHADCRRPGCGLGPRRERQNHQDQEQQAADHHPSIADAAPQNKPVL